MAKIFPFRALRPSEESAPRVSSVPYDVVSTDEARALAADNPLSFLHVTRAEIDLPAGTDPYDPAVYAKAKASTIALPAGYDQTMLCEGAATLGELMTKWEADLGGAINASCDGAKCRVDVASKPDPACDTATDVEGCDGSAMMLEFEVDDAGAIVPTSLMCMGAG